jgi:hypothetical protein
VKTRRIFGENTGHESSSICNLLHSSITSSLLGPHFLPQHPILEPSYYCLQHLYLYILDQSLF